MIYTAAIVSGYGRGKFLGYPTLNLVIPDNFTSDTGIFAGWVWIESEQCQGAFHYGPVPAYNQPDLSLEVFVLDKDLEATPRRIRFSFEERLREVCNFSSEKELIAQITEDVQQTKTLLDRL